MKRTRLQFRLRTLLVVAIVIPVAIAGLNQVRLNDPDRFRELALWTIVASGGLAFRPFGALMGRHIGRVAHHALAWFAATLGAAAFILAINAVDSPASFLRDIPDGLGAASIIYGIVFGTFVELGFFLLKAVRTDGG